MRRQLKNDETRWNVNEQEQIKAPEVSLEAKALAEQAKVCKLVVAGCEMGGRGRRGGSATSAPYSSFHSARWHSEVLACRYAYMHAQLWLQLQQCLEWKQLTNIVLEIGRKPPVEVLIMAGRQSVNHYYTPELNAAWLNLLHPNFLWLVDRIPTDVTSICHYNSRCIAALWHGNNSLWYPE